MQLTNEANLNTISNSFFTTLVKRISRSSSRTRTQETLIQERSTQVCLFILASKLNASLQAEKRKTDDSSTRFLLLPDGQAFCSLIEPFLCRDVHYFRPVFGAGEVVLSYSSSAIFSLKWLQSSKIFHLKVRTSSFSYYIKSLLALFTLNTSFFSDGQVVVIGGHREDNFFLRRCKTIQITILVLTSFFQPSDFLVDQVLLKLFKNLFRRFSTRSW